jgi:chemotaxis protein methyltransferase CheR
MLQPDQLKSFARFIESELGIVYSEANYFQLQSRIDEIAGILGLKDDAAVAELARGGITGQLKQCLLDRATNNETSFFRDPKVFTAIHRHLLPQLLASRRAMGPLRIWSAASSFGQEPYSLAMTCREVMAGKPDAKVEILATDISERALKRASAGLYSQLEVQRGLPTLQLVKYFDKTADDHWQIKSTLKDLVRFQAQNLLHPLERLGQFDLILCRNVLIYQSVENKKEILTRLARCLAPGGYLILGAGESLLGLTDAFRQSQCEGVYFYQLATEVQKQAA